jgi:hypothetical protein
MSSSLITKAKHFDGSLHTYDEPVVDARGGKSVRTKYKSQALNIQIPWMLTWGVNKWEDENTGRCKYDASLQFDPNKSETQTTFLDEMKTFEEKIKQDAVKNSKKWFGKKMTYDVVDALMYPILRYPKDKESGEPDLSRNPTLKLKVPFWEGRFNVEVYDANKQPLYLPPAFGKEGDGNQAPKQDNSATPQDFIPKGSHVKGIIRCNGLWFVGGKFGVTWQMLQMNTRPPVRIVGSGKCAIEDDSDDEGFLEELAAKEAEEQQEQIRQEVEEEVSTQPVEADEDDEDEDEDKEVAPSPPKPKKKKKVVRRKKKVAADA